MHETRSTLAFVLGVLSMACTDVSDDPAPGDSTSPGDTDAVACLDTVELPPYEPPNCATRPQDYQPGSGSWPSCITDDGEYHLIGTTPGTIARIEAYERIVARLRGASPPTAEDFTAARTDYALDEGLESRLQRREDLRVDPIPMSDWDPGVDEDKQCTLAANVTNYPQRCIGPSTMGPLINEAFAAGQIGEGNPRILAARIDGALLWFLYLSVHKEAVTCFTSKAVDCDSSWAYYTGGTNRSGGLGLARLVRDADLDANEAIWDGVAAFRCLRDLEPADDDPSLEDLSETGRARFDAADNQLQTALAFATAQILRDNLAELVTVCDENSAAKWEFVRTFARVLDPDLGDERSRFQAILDTQEPSEADILELWDILASHFNCP